MSHDFNLLSSISIVARIIIFAGIVQGFFLAFVLTTKKNRRRKSNWILAVLLAVISLSIMHSVLFTVQVKTPYVIREPFVLLLGPLLLFYVRKVFGITPFRSIDMIHFVPLLLFFLVPAVDGILGPESGYSRFIYEYSVPISLCVWAFIVAQYGFYWWRIVHLLHANLLAVESEFSSLEGRTLSWMKSFLHIFGILFVLLALTVVVAIHTIHYDAVDTIVAVGLSCVVFVLGYEGLFQEEVFSTTTGLAGTRDPERRRPAKSAEESAVDAQLSERLITHFETQKPYLDEGLTLTSLAAQLNTTRNQLSAVINAKSGGNFYVFVNRYRVDEVKRLIADPKNKNFTILTLAYQAGFPSKSSFQEIFKKFTGMTPSEYQRSIPKI